uniref:Tyrosine--tRNA ligase n=1 Tax=Panagrolaimus sp. JU765 TaxID=591449 RepID=A0AC34RHT4_9BILA
MEWYKNMSMIDFLRLSRKFRVGHMLRLGHIKNRMKDDSDAGISFTEFSYQVLQSYDWKVLAEKYNCFFQLGGSDQLGHLDIGAHYLKNVLKKSGAGICLPLITDAFGNKLGKSSASKGDAIWLNPDLTSPFAFYQYFRQLHDDSAEKFLPYFSLKPLEEVEGTLQTHRQNLGKWIAQTALADELTELVHGKDGLKLAKQCSNVLFNGSIEDLKLLDLETVTSLFGEASIFKLKRANVTTFGQLAEKTRKDKVKGSVLMTKGAFKVNGIRKD